MFAITAPRGRQAPFTDGDADLFDAVAQLGS
jgi:hypothetical protein